MQTIAQFNGRDNGENGQPLSIASINDCYTTADEFYEKCNNKDICGIYDIVTLNSMLQPTTAKKRIHGAVFFLFGDEPTAIMFRSRGKIFAFPIIFFALSVNYFPRYE